MREWSFQKGKTGDNSRRLALGGYASDLNLQKIEIFRSEAWQGVQGLVAVEIGEIGEH